MFKSNKPSDSFIEAIAQVAAHKPEITENDELVHVAGFGRIAPHQVHQGAAHHLGEVAKHHASGNYGAAAYHSRMATSYLEAAAHHKASQSPTVHKEVVDESKRFPLKKSESDSGEEGEVTPNLSRVASKFQRLNRRALKNKDKLKQERKDQ